MHGLVKSCVSRKLGILVLADVDPPLRGRAVVPDMRARGRSGRRATAILFYTFSTAEIRAGLGPRAEGQAELACAIERKYS
jgi:hypothetical protein